MKTVRFGATLKMERTSAIKTESTERKTLNANQSNLRQINFIFVIKIKEHQTNEHSISSKIHKLQ